MVLTGIASGFVYGNVSVVFGIFVAAIGGMIFFGILSLLTGVFGYSGNGSPEFLEVLQEDVLLFYRALLIPVMPAVSVFLLMACIFQDTAIGVWVVDGRSVERRSTVFAIPFLQDIRHLGLSHYLEVKVTATTKDGAPVAAFLTANMQILANDSTVMRIIRDFNGENAKIIEELKRVLQEKFRDAVQGMDLRELNNTLVIEWQTGKRFDEGTLSALGVEWSGRLQVSNIYINLVKPKAERV